MTEGPDISDDLEDALAQLVGAVLAEAAAAEDLSRATKLRRAVVTRFAEAARVGRWRIDREMARGLYWRAGVPVEALAPLLGVREGLVAETVGPSPVACPVCGHEPVQARSPNARHSPGDPLPAMRSARAIRRATSETPGALAVPGES